MASSVGCIFDMDGTLLDSMGVWEQVDADFFVSRGIDVPADYSSAVVAMPFDQIAEYTIERFKLPETPVQIMQEWNDLARWAYTHTVQVKPHAVGYLKALHEHGIPLAVATSLPKTLRDPALAHAQISDYFDVVCSTDEVSKGKESADIYVHAAQLLGVESHHAVVFEDILTGIKAAKSVGMHAWAMYDESSHQDWAEIQKVADGAIRDFSEAPRLWEEAGESSS